MMVAARAACTTTRVFLAEAFHPWLRQGGGSLDLDLRVCPAALAVSGNLGFFKIHFVCGIYEKMELAKFGIFQNPIYCGILKNGTQIFV